MNEAISPGFIGWRRDSLQNNIAGVNRWMIALETNLNERLGARRWRRSVGGTHRRIGDEHELSNPPDRADRQTCRQAPSLDT
jgi:hypothetical protein